MDKPGYKTSEFWISTLAVLVGVLFASGAFGEQSMVYRVLEVLASILAAMGYTVVRGSLKKALAAKSEGPTPDWIDRS